MNCHDIPIKSLFSMVASPFSMVKSPHMDPYGGFVNWGLPGYPHIIHFGMGFSILNMLAPNPTFDHNPQNLSPI